jgi:hypothetical protein
VVTITNSMGSLISQQRYLPFGQVRMDVGLITQTDLAFTGQCNLDAQGNVSLGLMDYNARMYDDLCEHDLPAAFVKKMIKPRRLTQDLSRVSGEFLRYALKSP